MIPSQKTADIILQMVESLDFLYTSKGKETPKIDANSSNQRSKNSYLLRDLMNFNEIFWEKCNL